MTERAKVRKCPRCSGLFLLWTNVCMRCGRIDPREQPRAAGSAPQAPGAEAPPPGSGRMTMIYAPIKDEVGFADTADGKVDPQAVKVDKVDKVVAKELEPVAEPDPDANHYLILGYRDAVELVPGKRFLMGRGTGVNLRIPNMDVSRLHASIDWVGPRPFVRDLSGKLTQVGSRSVAKDSLEALRDGDQVRLGPTFEMTYRNVTEKKLTYEVFAADKRPSSPSSGDAQQPIVASSKRVGDKAGQVSNEEVPLGDPGGDTVKPAPPASQDDDVPLEGDFSVTPATEVLASIFRRQLTGGLIISKAPGTGALRIEQGRVKGVVFRMRTGQEAAEEVKTLTQGAYRFVQE